MTKPRNPEILAPGNPLPPGTKEVRRTTTERYTASTTDADHDVDDEVGHGSNGHVTDLQDELDEIGLSGGDDPEGETVEDKFLRSLREGSDSGGTLRIFARRVPDPVGFNFKNPCKTEYTAGEVPFDNSELSMEGIELAIQSLYGGGRYQIIVRRNGDYAGARTRNIMDPPEKKVEAAAQVQSSPPPVHQAPRSAVDELKSSINLVREVMNLVHREGPAQPPLPPAPADPLQTTKDTLGLLKELRELVPTAAGGPEVGKGSETGNSARDWLDGVSGLARSLGVGQMVNNFISYALNEAARQRAVQNGQSPPQQQPVPSQPSSVHAEPLPAMPPPALNQPSPPVDPTQPEGFGLDLLPPPLRIAVETMLDVVVAEIKRNEVLDENDTSVAVAALNEFVVEYEFAFGKVDEWMCLPSVKLHIMLSQIKPEYADLLELDDATGFLAQVKREWAEGKAAAMAASEDSERQGEDSE